MAIWRKVSMAALAGMVPGIARAAAFDVDHATARYLAMVSPAEQARADAYFTGKLWLNIASQMITVLICWIILRSGVLVRVRDAMRRQGWRPWVIMLVIAAVFMAALFLLGLPLTIYAGYVRDRRFGMSTVSPSGWMSQWVVGGLIQLVWASVLLTVVNAMMRRFPNHWWIIGTGVVAAGLAVINLLVLALPPPMSHSPMAWRVSGAFGVLTLLAALEFWLLAKLGPFVLALWGRRRGPRTLDDPAALPVLIGLLILLSLVLLPATNTVARYAQNARDAAFLDAMRNSDDFAWAALIQAPYRTISPPAWEEALFYDKPSARTRVARAMQWKKDHVPNATEHRPPPLPDPGTAPEDE